MSDTTQSRKQRGDERLLASLLAFDRLCAEQVPASARLEAAVGPLDIQSLVVPLAGRLIAHGYDVPAAYDSAAGIAAA